MGIRGYIRLWWAVSVRVVVSSWHTHTNHWELTFFSAFSVSRLFQSSWWCIFCMAIVSRGGRGRNFFFWEVIDISQDRRHRVIPAVCVACHCRWLWLTWRVSGLYSVVSFFLLKGVVGRVMWWEWVNCLCFGWVVRFWWVYLIHWWTVIESTVYVKSGVFWSEFWNNGGSSTQYIANVSSVNFISDLGCYS